MTDQDKEEIIVRCRRLLLDPACEHRIYDDGFERIYRTDRWQVEDLCDDAYNGHSYRALRLYVRDSRNALRRLFCILTEEANTRDDWQDFEDAEFVLEMLRRHMVLDDLAVVPQ